MFLQKKSSRVQHTREDFFIHKMLILKQKKAPPQ
ncbi:MAG: hypothetical protein RL757_1287 [Bacteroidota bacterium]|jgi:hypothetical protein